MSNFISRCVEGLENIKNIKNCIEQYSPDSEQYFSLADYLGMTEHEYKLWTINNNILVYIIQAHKTGRDINEVLAKAVIDTIKKSDYGKKIHLITPEMFDEMQELFELGMRECHICDYFGIKYRTWLYWKKQAREIEEKIEDGRIIKDDLSDDENNMLRVLHASKKGKAVLIKNSLKKINSAIEDGTWQAAFRLLESVDNESFGRQIGVKAKVKINMSDNKRKRLDEIFNGDD